MPWKATQPEARVGVMLVPRMTFELSGSVIPEKSSGWSVKLIALKSSPPVAIFAAVTAPSRRCSVSTRCSSSSMKRSYLNPGRFVDPPICLLYSWRLHARHLAAHSLDYVCERATFSSLRTRPTPAHPSLEDVRARANLRATHQGLDAHASARANLTSRHEGRRGEQLDRGHDPVR